jgi:hypothetical protein
VEIVEEINIDIDPIMPMSIIVENYLQPTPPTTCAKLSRTRQRVHKLGRRKLLLLKQ